MQDCGKLGGLRPEATERQRILCSDCVQRPRCLPARLDARALSRFQEALEQSGTLPAGQTLVCAGSPVRAFFALQYGAVKSLHCNANGMEQVVAFHFPGSVLGLHEPASTAWSCTHVALEDTQVCRIPPQALNKELRRRLAELIRGNLQKEYEFHLKLADCSATQRLAAFLLRLYEGVASPSLHFLLPMSRLDIASYMGLTQAALHQGFKELDVFGWVRTRGQEVDIRDLAGLRRFDRN